MKTANKSFLLFLFCGLAGLAACLPSGTFIYPTVTPVPLIRHMADSLMGIQPTWTLDNVYVVWNEHDTTMDSSMGKTCFLGDLADKDFYGFICLDSRNGQTLWITRTEAHRIIDVSKDGIFVAFSSPGVVAKYDLDNGSLVWRKKLGGTGSIGLTYMENQLQVATVNPETLWVLDTNAVVIRKIRNGGDRVFLSTQEATYVNLNGLQARNPDTDEIVWEHFDSRLRLMPIFTEDKIFLRNGVTFSGTAYALERASGVLLWEIPNVVGNLAYVPEKHLVYALQIDGRLLAIEESSGKWSVIAAFSPNPFVFSDGVDTSTYQLAYDSEEDVLVVYLGDSRQLFAFKAE